MLITGASGFVGSFIAEKALGMGYETWVGVRRTSSRAYLTDPRLHFIEMDLGDRAGLRSSLAVFRRERGLFDYVVHAAGVTKARRRGDFEKGNTVATLNLAEALTELRMAPRRFVFISSLSVMGAVREQRVEQGDGHHYLPITQDDEPAANTAYALSKLEAERVLGAMAGLPLVVLRPTGIYGPRDKDYLMLVRNVAKGRSLRVGRSPQELTFVYVRDVAKAAMLACTAGPVGATYLLSDGQTYSAEDFADVVGRELGVERLRRYTVPLAVLRVACVIGGMVGRLGRPTPLNPDKYRILSQRNWRCDIEPARTGLGFEAEYDLCRGMKETIAWYKQNNWL